MTRSSDDNGDLIQLPTEDYDARRNAIYRMMQAVPSARQAKAIRSYLVHETDSDIAASLMRALVHHEGRMEGGGGTWTITLRDLLHVFPELLAAAENEAVRAALHRGFIKIYPSAQQIGVAHSQTVEVARASLLKTVKNSSWRKPESPSAEFLFDRCGRSEAEVFQSVQSLIDLDPEGQTEDTIDLWRSWYERAARSEPWRKESMAEKSLGFLIDIYPKLTHDDARRSAASFIASRWRDDPKARRFAVRLLDDPSPLVKWAVIDALTPVNHEYASEVYEVLEREEEYEPLHLAWVRLFMRPIPTEDLLRKVAKNPHVDTAASVVVDGCLWCDHPMDPDPEAIRALWHTFPPGFREALERAWRPTERRAEGPPGHCDLLHWIAHHVEGRAKARPIQFEASFSWLIRPLHEVLGVYDLDRITGLRRETPVEMRTLPLLRFGFLAEGRTHDDKPLADALWRFDRFQLPKLAELERRFDEERDRLAELTSELNAVATEIGDDMLQRLRRARDRDEAADLGAEGDRLGNQRVRLDALLAEQDALGQRLAPASDNGPYAQLFAASKQFGDILAEIGCNFQGLAAPDGVLGEYQPADRSITLFGPMIELAARDAARQLGMTSKDVASRLRTVVEIHELAHAQIHLGQDSVDGIWADPGSASAGLHEALAQSYTRRLIGRMDLPGLAETLRVIEGWLPGEYRFADHLDAVDAEALRAWLIARRLRASAKTLEAIAGQVIKTLPGYLRMLLDTVGRPALGADAGRVLATLREVAVAGPQELPERLDRLLAAVGTLPQATQVLGAYLPGGWPGLEDRSWLLFEARTRGPAVGPRPLRFIRKEDRILAVAASGSAAALGIEPVLRACEHLLAPAPAPRPSPASGRQRRVRVKRR